MSPKRAEERPQKFALPPVPLQRFQYQSVPGAFEYAMSCSNRSRPFAVFGLFDRIGFLVRLAFQAQRIAETAIFQVVYLAVLPIILCWDRCAARS